MAIAKKNSACRLSTVVFVGFLQTVCPYRSEDEVDNLLQAMDTESTDENVTQGASELEKSNQSKPFSQSTLDKKRSRIVGKTCGGGAGWVAATGVSDWCMEKNSECLNEQCYCAEMHYYDPGYPACKACCKGDNDDKFSWGTETARYWGCASGYKEQDYKEAGRDGDQCADTSAQEGRNTPDTGRECTFGGDAVFAIGNENTHAQITTKGTCMPSLNTRCNGKTGKCQCIEGYFHDQNTDACKQCCVYGKSYTWGSGPMHGCQGQYQAAPDGAHCR